MGVEYSGQIGYGFKLSEEAIERLKAAEDYDDYGDVEEYLWNILPESLDVVRSGSYYGNDPFDFIITVSRVTQPVGEAEGQQFVRLDSPLLTPLEGHELFQTAMKLEERADVPIAAFYAGLGH